MNQEKFKIIITIYEDGSELSVEKINPNVFIGFEDIIGALEMSKLDVAYDYQKNKKVKKVKKK